MITVSAADRPLNVAAIVEHGRVLLPMRATFEALGALVRYDPDGRVILARGKGHWFQVSVGSRNAIVDGRPVRLDVPAREVAGRTYVPLRFAGQALGAVVEYDERAQLVTVNYPGQHAYRSALPVAANQPAEAPAANSNVDTPYPTIGAVVPGGGMATDARLSVDGTDVTSLGTFDGTMMTYIPRSPLAVGPHTVAFSGYYPGGAPFTQNWGFTTVAAPYASPNVASFGNYQFYATGPSAYYPGDWMHFVLVGPPGGSGYLQFCGGGLQYPFTASGVSGVYEANIPAPYGFYTSSCGVNAVYLGYNGARYYIPNQLNISVYTGRNPYYPYYPYGPYGSYGQLNPYAPYQPPYGGGGYYGPYYIPQPASRPPGAISAPRPIPLMPRRPEPPPITPMKPRVITPVQPRVAPRRPPTAAKVNPHAGPAS